MNCTIIQDILPLYWDLPENDPQKPQIDCHLLECEQCTKQFQRWMISLTLIRTLKDERTSMANSNQHDDRIADRVMTRIYAEQLDLQPVLQRPTLSNTRVRELFMKTMAASFLLVLGMMVYALIQISTIGNVEQMAITDRSLQMVSLETPAPTQKMAEYGKWPLLLAYSSALMLSLMLLLSWFNRLRE
jgi:predicted anti-sigma-YlaC factor YlaD